MPDAPDSYQYNPQSKNVGSADRGELAVRLGAPYQYLRTGLVAFQDDFSNGRNRWKVQELDDESVAQIVTYPVGVGAFSLQVTPGDDFFKQVTLKRSLSLWDVSRNGFLVGFFAGEDIDSMEIFMYYTTATDYIYARVLFDQANLSLKVYTNDASYTEVGTFLDPYYADPQLYYLKVIADFDTGYYVRAYLNEESFDLSSLLMRHTTGSYDRSFKAQIDIKQSTGQDVSMWIDSVVLTVDEPIGL